MKKIFNIILLATSSFLALSSCTTYDGAAYIKKDLASLVCSHKSVQKADIKTATDDCIKSNVDDEYFKQGVSEATLDWIREAKRAAFRSCMSDKGFACSWAPEK